MAASVTSNHNLVARLHHGTEEGSAKRKVGKFLESTWVEIMIVVLVLCDIVLLGIEHGIDHHLLCIEGEVAPLAPHPLVKLANAHADEHGSLLQTLAAPPYGVGPYADFLRAGDVAPPLGSRRTGQGRGSMELDTPPDALLAESGSLSPLSLLEEGEKGAQSLMGLLVKIHPEHDHPKHRHNEHGDEEHGHEEHRHVEHSDEEHGHAGHDDGAHGHHHVNKALVCETRDGPNAHHLYHTCHTLSIIVLVIFLVEILAKIWVNAPEFFHNPFEVLDLVVVVLSLIVDVIILPWMQQNASNHQGEAEDFIFVLMICRLWRVVRIFHGLFEVVHHQVEEVHELTARITELEGEIADRNGKIKLEAEV